jgi:serine-type D-Ala-D-Ala carboxypeptidase/endopeptidase
MTDDRIALTAAALALVLPSCAIAAPTSYASRGEIQQSLDAYVSKAPGVVVIAGVIDHGDVRIYTAGTPPHGAPPLNEDAVFQIGSITKTFTATLLADLVGSGNIRLDSPLSEYFPANVHIPAYHSQPITLLNLAEQNSGLPRLPTNLDMSNAADPYASYTEADAERFLTHYEMTRAPGSQYEYSNLGVSLLGAALSSRMRASYASLLQARVLTPLGMHETGFDLKPFAARLMPGFTADLTPAQPWTGEFIAPAGGLYSSMRDMLRYLQANLEAPKGPLGPAMDSAQQPRAMTDGPPYVKIGLIWNVNVANGNTWHNGQTGGYHAIMLFNRAQRSGVVLMANVADMNLDNLGVHIIAPTVVAVPPPIERVTAHGSSPYVGVYRLTPTFVITIYEDNGVLYERATGQQALGLKLVSDATFSVEGVDAQITFLRNKAGQITSLVLHQGGTDQTAPRMP